jgi:hypothetical protein
MGGNLIVSESATRAPLDPLVMAGLDPAIHACFQKRLKEDVDARPKAGHDEQIIHHRFDFEKRSASHQFRRSVMNQPKTHPADQVASNCLGVANVGLGLAQRAYIGSEGHDPTQHQRNRSERRRQTNSEQAKYRDEQQDRTTPDRDLGRQNELSASLGNLGQRLDPRFDG